MVMLVDPNSSFNWYANLIPTSSIDVWVFFSFNNHCADVVHACPEEIQVYWSLALLANKGLDVNRSWGQA